MFEGEAEIIMEKAQVKGRFFHGPSSGWQAGKASTGHMVSL